MSRQEGSFGDHCIPHLTFEEIRAQRHGGCCKVTWLMSGRTRTKAQTLSLEFYR